MSLPQLRFPQFEGDWKSNALSDLSDVRDGTHDTPKYHPTGKALITSKNLLEGGSLDLKNVNLISEQDFDKINKRSKVDSGDILFGMIGTIGNPVMVDSCDFAIKNVALIKESKKLGNSFLKHYLKSNSIAKQIAQVNAGNSQKFVSLSQVRGLIINFPAYEDEAKKIAHFLSSTSDKIELLEKRLDLMSSYRYTLIQKIFNQDCRFKDDDGKEFEEWRSTSLGEVLLDQHQGINTTADKVKYLESGFPILQAKHITNEILDFSDVKYVDDITYQNYKNKFKPLINDLLISNIGTLGKIVLIEEELDFLVAWNIFKATPNISIINPQFLEYQLKKLVFDGLFESIKTGNATKFVNKTELLSIDLLLPAMKEQVKIAKFFASIDKKVASIKQQLELTMQYKQVLLQQMFV